MTWRLSIPAVVTALCIAGAPGFAAAQPIATAKEATAIKQFEDAIARYLAMRQKLAAEVPGPVPGSTSTKLTQASDALAAAIQRARAKAKPGDLFASPVAGVIKQRVVNAVQHENLAAALTEIDDEEPGPAAPSIHMRFPAAAPLATMPPSLLAILPDLPPSLEYRIIGKFLVLRDVEAALILDFIPAAIPR